MITPGDSALRHDILRLADHGIIKGPVSTWPLAWGPIIADISNIENPDQLPRDVSDAIASLGCSVEKSEIRMPEGALRMVGEHLVDIHLYTDIDTQVTVNIIGEE